MVFKNVIKRQNMNKESKHFLEEEPRKIIYTNVCQNDFKGIQIRIKAFYRVVASVGSVDS